MSSLVEVMRRNGIVRPDEVVELARSVGIDLAAACVLLVKESGGGRNVWGADPVTIAPGTYRKGGEVTRENYAGYARAVREGRAGRQGVGPTQLTAADYQDAADRLGGCWDWRTNVLVGLRTLAGHITRYGERGGFVAYNGGPGAVGKGPRHPAQLYGDDAARKLAAWRLLLSPALQEVDVPITVQDAQMIADAVWRRPTANGFGDVVEAAQILAGGERRIADVQAAGPATGGVDLDALAAKVVDLLAARLGR